MRIISDTILTPDEAHTLSNQDIGPNYWAVYTGDFDPVVIGDRYKTPQLNTKLTKRRLNVSALVADVIAERIEVEEWPDGVPEDAQWLAPDVHLKAIVESTTHVLAWRDGSTATDDLDEEEADEADLRWVLLENVVSGGASAYPEWAYRFKIRDTKDGPVTYADYWDRSRYRVYSQKKDTWVLEVDEPIMEDGSALSHCPVVMFWVKSPFRPLSDIRSTIGCQNAIDQSTGTDAVLSELLSGPLRVLLTEAGDAGSGAQAVNAQFTPDADEADIGTAYVETPDYVDVNIGEILKVEGKSIHEMSAGDPAQTIGRIDAYAKDALTLTGIPAQLWDGYGTVSGDMVDRAEQSLRNKAERRVTGFQASWARLIEVSNELGSDTISSTEVRFKDIQQPATTTEESPEDATGE